MGIMANYMMIDDETLDIMTELDSDDLLDKIDELEELKISELYCMDKLWDGLHFLLTGASASKPIKGNHLSEAIIGVHVFDTYEDYFVGCAEFSELPDIIAALKDVNTEKLKEKFKLSRFRIAKIYPDIWERAQKEKLWRELLGEFNGILEFYQRAEQMKMHVIVSIF